MLEVSCAVDKHLDDQEWTLLLYIFFVSERYPVVLILKHKIAFLRTFNFLRSDPGILKC